MKFPDIKMTEWKFIEKDHLWISPRNGVEIKGGENSLYGKKTNKDNPVFKQFLMNSDIYGYGVMVVTWVLFEIHPREKKLKCFLVKILKDGRWITGLLNKNTEYYQIKDEVTGRSFGLKLRLQTGKDNFTELEVKRDAGGKA